MLEIHKGIDGAFTLRSARSVSIEKYAVIPVPKEMHAPEERADLGDSSENYKAAAAFGKGPVGPHIKREWKWTSGAEAKPSEALAQLWDYHAYFANYYNQQPLAAHVKDYALSEETRAPGQPAEGVAPVAAYYYKRSALGGKFQYAMPPYAELKVDHRFQEPVRYYRSRSGIDLLPDGSVSITDGYGSAIRMSGGNVYISGPGDVFLQPGRNVVALAPQDVILRAQRGVDISAATRDVRVKAEVNLHMLAGNGGRGGMLLESRGAGEITPGSGEDASFPGVVIKAGAGGLTCYGDSVYVRSEQDLVMDAGSGAGRLVSIGRVAYRMLGSAVDAFGVTPTGSAEEAVYTYADRSNLFFGQAGSITARAREVLLYGDTTSLTLSGTLRVEESLVVGGQLALEGNLISNGAAQFQGALVALAGASLAGGPWAQLRDGMPEPVEILPQFSEMPKTADDRVEFFGTAGGDLFSVVEATVYRSGGKGDALVLPLIGFSFRSQEQYNLLKSDFVLVEQPWQQVYRVHNIGHTWTEPEVVNPHSGKGTLPYPGIELWAEDATLSVNALALWDWESGRAKDRSTCSGAVGVESERLVLAKEYRVSVPSPQ